MKLYLSLTLGILILGVFPLSWGFMSSSGGEEDEDSEEGDIYVTTKDHEASNLTENAFNPTNAMNIEDWSDSDFEELD